MKKILTIIMAICLMASLLCIAAFAAENGTVLRVSALKTDGETVVIEDYDSFEDGWNAAVKLANGNTYERVIVDIYADWKANSETGNFTDDAPWETNGPGFDNDTIYFNDDVRMTLNMNGHTIDRGLNNYRSNGEVMYIDTDADVIINNGTITGGGSCNGAGGIHINSGAKVTLNNVNVVSNIVCDDDGAGIALYNGASLTMNGGSLNNNELWHDDESCYGGAIYAKESSVTLNNVEIKNNQTLYGNDYGAAIYAVDSNVSLDQCTFDGNGVENEANNAYASVSTIHCIDSVVTAKKSTFINNGGMYSKKQTIGNGNYAMLDKASSVFFIGNSNLTIEEDCKFSNNTVYYLIRTNAENVLYVSNSTFANNNAFVLYSNSQSHSNYFNNCTFINNMAKGISNRIFIYTFHVSGPVVFYECVLTSSTFNNKEIVQIVSPNVSKEEAVLGVNVLLEDGTVDFAKYYKDFESGWNESMELAKATNAYDRVVVDIYADWIANDGEFCNSGAGFDWDAIYFPANVKVTLNMNGKTIDRGLKNWQGNGEVICIAEGADVIIKDGTITGGYSAGGAGGIHIKENAKVVLEGVNVVKNKAYGSNGAAIAVKAGAVLVMNGGSISENAMRNGLFTYPYGTLHVYKATAMLNDVTISGNYNANEDDTVEGVAIYVDEGTVTMNNCVVSGNAVNASDYAESIIGAFDSELIIKNTDFIGNGAATPKLNSDYSYLLYLKDSTLTMEGGKITGDKDDIIFYFDDSKADITGVTVTDNASLTAEVDNGSEMVTMTECVLGNNNPIHYDEDIVVDEKGTLNMVNCTLGDTTFEDKSLVLGVGSVFGEGSMTNILVFISLACSAVSIFLTMAYTKKKTAPAVAADDEE